MILDKRYNPLYPNLIELAFETVQTGGVSLRTDCGWFDHAELVIEWDGSHFEATITAYEEGAYYPASLYEPAETVYQETTETARFRKIRELDQWATRWGFGIDTARKIN